MNVLIVTATLDEIKPFMDQFGFNFFNKKGDHELDILITGVGMVATTYELSRVFYNKKYDLAINAGIAGSFDSDIEIGEVVHVQSDLFSELGAQDGEHFLSLIQLGLQTYNESPFSWGELTPKTLNTISLSNLKKVRAITVNTVHGNNDSILSIKNRLNPQIESMEGASFFYCCMKENISCLQIRSISNYIEKRNRANWDIPLAVENLNKTLDALIKELVY